MQAHTASIHEHADCLTGLGDSPSETLMVTVLLISLPEPYSPLIISLDIRNLTLLFSVVSTKKRVSFPFQDRNSLRARIQLTVQRPNRRRTRRMLRVTNVVRKDTTRMNVKRNWRKQRKQRLQRRRRARHQSRLSQSLQIPTIRNGNFGDSGGMARVSLCGHACARGGMLEIGEGLRAWRNHRYGQDILFYILIFIYCCYVTYSSI